MNIKEAKEEIKRTLKAYTGLGETPVYSIPESKQRPILLIGPPGIGKTAIMEQIAQECGAGLVSYTMTHHTRQSAIGLPYLREEQFEHSTFQVTEYTMSEIIASVYECIRTTGCRCGILFIDEINCVSETLVPVMLQFLQNKTFGMHRIPEHWMIVAAGNPSEYNRSVREFDMATLDRVRKIEIEADYSVWQEYAVQNDVHPAILSYLAIHPDCFYSSRLDSGERSFVTARGWEDLSCILHSYEGLNEPVCAQLIGQYLQHEEIARDFALYYRLFQKYRETYTIPELLCTPSDMPLWQEQKSRIDRAPIDERLAVSSLVLHYLHTCLTDFFQQQNLAKRLSDHCRSFLSSGTQFKNAADYIRKQRSIAEIRCQNHLSSPEERLEELYALDVLADWITAAPDSSDVHFTDTETQDLSILEKNHADLVKKKAETLSFQINQAFQLLQTADPQDLCVLYLATDLSRMEQAAEFLFHHPCPAYLEASKELFCDKNF